MNPNAPHSDNANADAVMTEAATWLVRMTSGETSAAERSAFTRWRKASPAHESALQDLLPVWGELGPALRRPARRTRKQVLGWAMAASVLIGCSLSWMMWPQANYDAVTTTGQQDIHKLADGSAVLLNSNSAIQTHFSTDTRTVELARGEAFFDVTSDPQRPFQVRSGDSLIEVRGTRFSVRRLKSGVRVAVESGEVKVHHHDTNTTLRAGQSVFSDGDQLSAVSHSDIETMLAWRQGRLIFIDTPLATLAAELNRYTPERLLVMGDHARNIRLSAVVHIAEANDWLGRLDGTQGLKINRLGPIVLIR